MRIIADDGVVLYDSTDETFKEHGVLLHITGPVDAEHSSNRLNVFNLSINDTVDTASRILGKMYVSSIEGAPESIKDIVSDLTLDLIYSSLAKQGIMQAVNPSDELN